MIDNIDRLKHKRSSLVFEVKSYLLKGLIKRSNQYLKRESCVSKRGEILTSSYLFYLSYDLIVSVYHKSIELISSLLIILSLSLINPVLVIASLLSKLIKSNEGTLLLDKSRNDNQKDLPSVALIGALYDLMYTNNKICLNCGELIRINVTIERDIGKISDIVKADGYLLSSSDYLLCLLLSNIGYYKNLEIKIANIGYGAYQL